MTNNTFTTSTAKDARLVQFTSIAGYWDMNGTRFAVHKTPNRFHRLMVKWFFGWTYITNVTSTTTRQLLNG
jgi:hypothetical protein